MEKLLNWRRPDGDPLIGELKDLVEDTIIREKGKGHELKICIGTDSQVYGTDIHMATAIVFLRYKKGGFMFVSSDRITQKMGIRERMIKEVSRSIATAYQLCDLLDRYDVELEVHADINTDPDFPSNVALKEATGYILGMGFKFKVKPDAFASSSCADKMV